MILGGMAYCLLLNLALHFRPGRRELLGLCFGLCIESFHAISSLAILATCLSRKITELWDMLRPIPSNRVCRCLPSSIVDRFGFMALLIIATAASQATFGEH